MRSLAVLNMISRMHLFYSLFGEQDAYRNSFSTLNVTTNVHISNRFSFCTPISVITTRCGYILKKKSTTIPFVGTMKF